MRFGTDGDGNVGYYGADDSLIPFKSGYYQYIKHDTKIYNGELELTSPMSNYTKIMIGGSDSNAGACVTSDIETFKTTQLSSYFKGSTGVKYTVTFTYVDDTHIKYSQNTNQFGYFCICMV